MSKVVALLEQRFERGGHVHAVGRVKALFRGPEGQVSTVALLAAAGYPEAPSSQMPEAIRLWQEAEASDRGRRPRSRLTAGRKSDEGVPHT